MTLVGFEVNLPLDLVLRRLGRKPQAGANDTSALFFGAVGIEYLWRISSAEGMGRVCGA